MSILDIYLSRNSNSHWKTTFVSLAKGNKGRFFNYINTNFRQQKSFISQFNEFEPVEDVDRSQWDVQEHHGQERDKQRVVKLLEARLFQRKFVASQSLQAERQYTYNKTDKGNSYRKYIDKKCEDAQSWIINYVYLLNGNYGDEKNHILEATKRLLEIFRILNVPGEDISHLFDEIIHTKRVADLVTKDLFYIISFYGDIEFLEMYFAASDEEKTDLHNYILANLKNKDITCCVSNKYVSGGNYSHPMAIDELKVFYFTYVLLKLKSKDLNYVLDNLLDSYGQFFKFDKNETLEYLNEESEIVYLILEEVLEIELGDDVDVSDAGAVDLSPLEYIDTTTIRGRREANRIFSLKRKKAREVANYRCSLESHRSCQNHYFTSKATNKNYVEVHHLVPREYSNRYSSSIEVMPNYVTLCPGCHELLHKAVDRERKDHLTNLWGKRKPQLKILNLDIELEELFEYYGIDS